MSKRQRTAEGEIKSRWACVHPIFEAKCIPSEQGQYESETACRAKCMIPLQAQKIVATMIPPRQANITLSRAAAGLPESELPLAFSPAALPYFSEAQADAWLFKRLMQHHDYRAALSLLKADRAWLALPELLDQLNEIDPSEWQLLFLRAAQPLLKHFDAHQQSQLANRAFEKASQRHPLFVWMIQTGWTRYLGKQTNLLRTIAGRITPMGYTFWAENGDRENGYKKLIQKFNRAVLALKAQGYTFEPNQVLEAIQYLFHEIHLPSQAEAAAKMSRLLLELAEMTKVPESVAKLWAEHGVLSDFQDFVARMDAAHLKSLLTFIRRYADIISQQLASQRLADVPEWNQKLQAWTKRDIPFVQSLLHF